MAYGLKYELIGKSTPFNKIWKVRISREGYSGPQIDRNVPSNPFILRKDSAGTVRGTSLDFAIRAIADFEFIEFYTENSLDWLIELVDPSGAIVWKGFIIPEQYQEPYSPAPVTVSFTATDQLGLLKNFTYTAVNATRISYLSILKSCLSNSGLSLGYAIAIAIKESRQNQARSVLSEIYVNPEVYNGLTCYEVIVDILSHFDAEITQHAGRWLIRRSVDKQITRILYDATGTFTGTQAAPIVKSLGQLGVADVYPTGSELNMELATAERKLIISEDYQTKSSILPPQDADKWTDANTLPGWTPALAQLIKVDADIPYFLVKPADNGYHPNSFAKASILEVNTTTDSVEFAFDYAYITPLNLTDPGTGVPIPWNNVTISVMVTLFNATQNKTWYLSKATGWVEVLSRLEITDVKPSGSVNQNPSWFNFKILSSGIPANGTLSVILYRPIGPDTMHNAERWGAAFKNVSFNILHDEIPLPTGLNYAITLNKSTKAAEKEIKIIGGDVPVVANARLQFSSYTSLSDYHTLTGLWTMPGVAGTALLLDLVAKLYASENRKAKQLLTGSIRGQVIDFDTVLLHNYPTPRYFEIVEASYNLCADRADVTLVELFDYIETPFTVLVSDTSGGTSGKILGGGSGGSSTPRANDYTPPLTIINFTNISNPSVENYQANHALKHGIYPRVALYTTLANGNRVQRQEIPEFTIVAGLITRIVYDLSSNETGFILIS